MIKFLGTAGARYVVSRQLRSSAGIYLSSGGKNLILDPGPGTLVKLAKSRPRIDVTSLDALLLTHVHIDHSNDVNILIDGMTNGGIAPRGVLFAPREALEGEKAVILGYLRGFLDDIVILEPEKKYRLGDLRFSTSARHLHPAETYGLKFELNGKCVSFITDTLFSPEVIRSYSDSDILVINTVRRCAGDAKIMHLCVDDVKKIVSQLKPEKVYLTHFGNTMLKAKPWEVAGSLTGELGVEVAAAADGMTDDI